jgi:hypothetical protein
VSAEGDGETEALNSQPAEDECRAAGGGLGREQDDGGDGEEESGGQNEQSGEFHQRFLFVWMEYRDPNRPIGSHCWIAFRGRLRSLYEF